MNRVNQPDRVSLDSFMDTTTATDGQYYTFVNHAPNSLAVGVKEIALLRATIPLIQLPIPSYQLVFYYHRLATVSTIPDATTLRAVRLYPQGYIPPTGFTAFVENSFFQTPQELVDSLNIAAAAGGDNATYNTLYVPGDIVFTYDENQNEITFKGTAAGVYYCNAGYNSPEVLASQVSTAITTYNQDTTTSRQPFALGYTLNLRCGYAMDGINRPRGSGTNFLSNKCANLTGKSWVAGIPVWVDSYPCLTYTGNIYLYSNVVGNSGSGSVNKKNLLCVIPVDVPLGGIIQYVGHSTPAYAKKVASEIYSFDFELRDDANQPFYLPDSANVNIELSLIY